MWYIHNKTLSTELNNEPYEYIYQYVIKWTKQVTNKPKLNVTSCIPIYGIGSEISLFTLVTQINCFEFRCQWKRCARALLDLEIRTHFMIMCNKVADFCKESFVLIYCPFGTWAKSAATARARVRAKAKNNEQASAYWIETMTLFRNYTPKDRCEILTTQSEHLKFCNTIQFNDELFFFYCNYKFIQLLDESIRFHCDIAIHLKQHRIKYIRILLYFFFLWN